MTNRPVTHEHVDVAANQAERTTAPTRQLPVKPVEQIVAAIRQDSLESPRVYLDETKVPHGGE